MSSVGPPRAPVHVISSKNLEYSGIRNDFHFLEDEMATSSHIHEVLISITSPTHQSPLIGLHHWSPRQIHSSYLSPLTVKPEYLRGYEGFQELGSFCLPKECASSMVTVHAYLSCLIPKYGEDIVAPSTESGITASITAGLGAKTWPVSSTVTIRLFKMLVRGNSQEELFAGGEVAIWKSVWPGRNWHRRDSFWEPDLDLCLNYHKEVSPERLFLLVRGIPEERKEYFTECHVSHTHWEALYDPSFYF